MVLLVSSVFANTSSLYTARNAMIAPVNMPGLAMGNMILNTMPNVLHPSMMAASSSSLLILDEPITGLDPTAIQEFYTMIRRLNREDKVAILMVSHDLRNAVEEANKILHLQKRVLFYGPAHDYMNSQAAGHFFHEKEQGRCKPTAGCHTVKLHMHKEDKS